MISHAEKINCLIIDDEQEARDLLENLLHKFPEVNVLAKSCNVDEGIVTYLKYKPDLVFLDVQMPQKDGFEFIRLIQDIAISTGIVFVTAFHQYAIEAIKHSAFDYLLKPVNQQELKSCLERFKASRNHKSLGISISELLTELNNYHKIKLNTRSGFELIDPDHILYAEADGNYCHLSNINGNRLTSTMHLGAVEDLLPENQFFRISRSHIIHLKYLTSVDKSRKKCRLSAHDSHTDLPISKDRIRSLEEFFQSMGHCS